MNQEEIKMTKNFIKVQLEQVEQFKKFSDKIFHNMEDLLKDPTFEKNSDFSKRSKDFIDVISYLFLILEGQTIIELENSMAQSRWASIKAILEEQQLEEEKRLNEEKMLKLIPTVIHIEAQRKNSARDINATVSETYDEMVESIAISTGVSIRIESKSGTKSPKSKNTTPTQKLNVLVSNLRRYFYWQPNVNSELAEQLIDLKLKEIKAKELHDYSKSNRREPKNGYAPLN
jgi:hypothetical protein